MGVPTKRFFSLLHTPRRSLPQKTTKDDTSRDFSIKSRKKKQMAMDKNRLMGPEIERVLTARHPSRRKPGRIRFSVFCNFHASWGLDHSILSPRSLEISSR
ncbi:hypothetical protein CEXT_522651 [Caerostris extrusa]|uniref:Uncharacterized protein n=1 Tax=Caerostris extrusa TaxID=172846 RepID=A0AAV4MNR0_CAEEX|nr:hypothetical protein CEXT_522651 [Caerostris extrusa]